MAWREVSPKLRRDPPPKRVVEDLGRLEDDEEQEFSRSAGLVLEVDDQAVGNLRQALDDGIELGRSESHAASLEGRIAAPGNETRSALAGCP